MLGPQTLANSCVLSSGKYQGVRVFLGVFVDSRRRGPPCAPSHLKGVVRKGVPRKSEAERFFAAANLCNTAICHPRNDLLLLCKAQHISVDRLFE